MLRLGRAALSDAELVALLLGSGTSGANALDVARELLVMHGGLVGLARLDVTALMRTGGIGLAKAARLVAALELGRRRTSATDVRTVVRSSHDVAALVAPLLADAPRERVVAVVCDGQSKVIAVTVVAEGGAHGASFPIRDVLAEVLRRDGSAVALAHQHPGGEPEPSTADVTATRALAAAARQCGVRLLDHVVLAGGAWRSISAALGADVTPPGRRDD